ncbi:hypothetical protein TTHERM_00787150 (macronuclear) [Tetrahymena thermophila SB210]|uniref:Uncharacterized protein n=1 Tax=Tetrahymena thermophila (strain SB210) TaxID=312017 RepID=Q23ZE8_TETTS|nr:hypothetical protein TTHERM_00787150 [Tetrahymena thermophila SB210]EAS01909.1 hypothetical protein TTHERM_00787150 [Tetrahymena thermophila SB210]|eukprot:XP_001022154.1 hypothetical protein TTHERM_00787150 [Tetrahymena thermophila SB210]
MDSFEAAIEQTSSQIYKEYKNIEDLIQKSRNFIYSELKMTKLNNITLEKERNMFNSIINSIEDSEYREELIRVKQVFFQCIKQQMILFQQTLARHMDFIETIQQEYPLQLNTKHIRQLSKQKDQLLNYLLSQADDTSGRHSHKSKSSSSSTSSTFSKDITSNSFQSQMRLRKSFKTIPDSDGEDGENQINFIHQKKLFAY